MLSDHLLILSCAVLFEMYLLSSCSPIPLAIAQPKPKNATATFQAEKKDTSIQTSLQATNGTICLLHSGMLIQKLDLMRKHLSLSVKQRAILGTLPIVDSSI